MMTHQKLGADVNGNCSCRGNEHEGIVLLGQNVLHDASMLGKCNPNQVTGPIVSVMHYTALTRELGKDDLQPAGRQCRRGLQPPLEWAQRPHISLAAYLAGGR